MVLHILQIEGDPAAVDQDATLLTLFIEVGVERSDDVDALFAVVQLLNLNLFVVVEDASDLDFLEGEVALELINVSGFGPWERALVLRGDVNSGLSEQ